MVTFIHLLLSDANDKSNKFSTLASYIIVEGNYASEILDSISFNLIRVPYNIQKEIDALEALNAPNKDMIIRSLKGALPTTYGIN